MARFFRIRSGGRVPVTVAIATAFVLAISTASLLVAAAGARAAALKPGMVSGESAKLTPALQQIATTTGSSASTAAQARLMFLPTSGPGSPIRAGANIVVTARVSSTDPSVQQALRQAGAQIQTVSDRYERITFAVAPGDLDRIADVSAVLAVEPELQPLFSGQSAITNAVTCPWGAVRSEGDTQLQADQARAAFGVNGGGKKVGIISDSFDTWSSAPTRWSGDVATGDLPGATNTCGFTTPVQDLLDGPGEDEGRAMAQVVHDLAPGASLAFASAETSTAYPDLVSSLRSWGANVIADDVTWFNEPFFQDGPNAVAANAAAAAGIPYFSSGANSNLIVGGKNISSWEAPAFRSTTCPATLSQYNQFGGCMDFDPGSGVSNTEAITLAPGATFILDMQWAEPWYGVQTDLDAFLLDSNGNIVAYSDAINPGTTGTQKPFEAFTFSYTGSTTETVYLAIGKWASANPGNPRLKYVLMTAHNILGVQFPTSSGGDIVGPTIFGHNGAANAMTMAAVPYNDSTQVEPYSSRGPVTLYYGPVNGTTPASPLASPEVLAKPDAAATDGAQTTFFSGLSGGVYRFWGTSEAAPHAAAIAALQLSAKPTATVDQVYAAEKRTAGQVGSFGSEAAGSGLLNAPGAVGVLVNADPTVVTGGASNVGWQSATVAGTVNPKGFATGYRFLYGTTQVYSFGTQVSQAGSGTTDVAVSAPLTGLTPSTTYHYRLIAIRFGVALASGADQTFTTQPPPIPTVTTGAAGAIGLSTATVAGTVNPSGYPTGYRFDYGTTTAYGSSTAAGDAGSGSSDVGVSAPLSGLTPNTTYHYRLVGLHGGSVAGQGADQTFATGQLPSNTSVPTIAGTATPGALLSCSPGTWTAASSFSYQWVRDGTAIPGAVRQTLTPAAHDLGHQFACGVTASNAWGATSATSATVTVVDLAPPRLTGLKLSPNRFKAASSGASIVLTGTKGTRVQFVLDEWATVTFTVERAAQGRTVKGRCLPQTHANRTAKRCAMWLPVKGMFIWKGTPGSNTFRFTGRVNGKALPRGSYRLVAAGRDTSGNRAAPVRVTFTIK
ncbi:MAG TPA: S8 family serine peptidase [Solirubrobacteraceae bacterium]|nr:S8 family serine peptidase [Solirubrobacteraceae bacterium]